MRSRLRILLVSPYHGGSHAAWAEGLARHSAHSIELLTLADRFWKWRMHGGAVTLARRFLRDQAQAAAALPDVVLATDMLDLTIFLALTRELTVGVPALLYMHENQLTYPLPADPGSGPMRRQHGERDRHYAFVNYASMLAATRVVFNSAFHQRSWFDALPPFLRHFPEHNELGTVTTLHERSTVLPVGIEEPPARDTPAGETDDTRAGDASPAGTDEPRAGDLPYHRTDEPPLLLWNQRWEYDKNPAELVRALRAVAARGIPFRLALCGQSFSEAPGDLLVARDALADHLVHFGFAEPDDYRRLLAEATLTVSTARHEFFGIGVLEAMAHGAFAVLPDRLSYPELLDDAAISAATRRRCLYRDHAGLVERLSRELQDPEGARRAGAELAAAARRFFWQRVAPRYDELFAEVATPRD